MTTLAQQFWTRFAAAPVGWCSSSDGVRLTTAAVALVRGREGDAAADHLQNLLDAADVADDVIYGIHA